MSMEIKQLHKWCSVQPESLEGHAELKTPFKLVKDSSEMGELMAREFVDEIKANNEAGRSTRAIVPCGPKCWYARWNDPFNYGV